jgi:hypothetical protein
VANLGWLNTVWAETVGLFVDDGSLALVGLVWLGICWLLTRVAALSHWLPTILFIGLALILVESAIRRAGKPRL